jgi:SAM-dependent methyltransferase
MDENSGFNNGLGNERINPLISQSAVESARSPMNSINTKIQAQFGPNAAAYGRSAVHAQGPGLVRLVELTQPQLDWHVLDVATGAGHTAFAFAPYVTGVTAVDLTYPMLTTATELARQRGLANIRFIQTVAEQLPFTNASFDLVVCRVAAHHFGEIGRFMSESARVLKPGGQLALLDNIVPGSRRRGKKAELERRAGAYVNAFEKLRDPSHVRCLSLDEWIDAYVTAGFIIGHQETNTMPLDFADWTARMQVSPPNRQRLRAMLLQAPEPVLTFLTPQASGDKIEFHLHKAIIIGNLAN